MSSVETWATRVWSLQPCPRSARQAVSGLGEEQIIIHTVRHQGEVVEIKDARFEAATEEDLERDKRGVPVLTVEGRKAVALRKWENLDPERLRSEIIFTQGDTVPYDRVRSAMQFIWKEEG